MRYRVVNMLRMPRQFLTWSVAALTLGCAGATEPETQSWAALFETVWSDVDQNYAFFSMVDVDWAMLHVAYRDSIEHSTSMARTAGLIGGMIRQLGYGHTALFTPVGVFAAASPWSTEAHFNPSFVETRYFAKPIQRSPSGRLQYTYLVDGTGYIYIGSFEGSGWGEEIDGVLADVGSAPAIIIDIRHNGGGSENVGIAIAARFYDTERVYRFGRFRNGPAHGDFGTPVPFTVRPSGPRPFRGPIALITDRWNGSAAEDFVLMISALPQAVTVGDTTAGIGSHPLDRTLPNGWSYRVPNSQEMTPDGFVYNFKGLPPRISVSWDLEVLSSGREPYIEAALAELKRRVSTPQ